MVDQLVVCECCGLENWSKNIRYMEDYEMFMCSDCREVNDEN